MKKLLIKLFAVLGFVSSATAADVVVKEGECWTYAARTGEEASFLVIRKIEILPKIGEVIHISVFGLKIKNPSAPGGYTDQAGHLPISGASLRGSLKTRVEKKIPDVDWKEGYQMWLDAKGGVFTKPVSECVGFLEEAINRGKKS
jgi:hypothetical protein